MISLWWLGLAALLAPIWWHRQRRQRRTVDTLATARFLPRTDPRQHRVWNWVERALLLVRCLLLATVVAWLADLVLPWRGDTVLVAPGTDRAWLEQQVSQAGYSNAERIEVPAADPLAWLASREREWRKDARLLVVGSLPMPAAPPRFAHRVEVRSRPAAAIKSEHQVAVVSKRAARWQALFAALEGPRRYVVSATPAAGTELIVWDLPQAPPPGLRAPLWWVGDSSAFPELKNAPAVDGIRYADSARGRLWASSDWPAGGADAARAQFENWQRLHYAPLAWPYPSGAIPATRAQALTQASGALRHLLAIALLALFALERILTHARRR